MHGPVRRADAARQAPAHRRRPRQVHRGRQEDPDLIDHRFSRDAFESFGTAAERRERARALADEIRALIIMTPTADGAISSILSRLRLVGHPLYPTGEGRFAGQDGETGLTLEFGPGGVEVSYAHRR